MRALLASLFSLLLWGTAPLAGQDSAPTPAEPTVKADTVAVIRLDRPISDKAMTDDPLLGTAAPESLREIVDRLHKAAADPKLAAVVVLWSDNGLGRGQAEELISAFDKVRAQKPLYAHADSLQTSDYVVLSHVSRLSVAPTGDVWVTGLYAEQLYLRGLFDLLQIRPDFVTCGDYKSAAEQYMRSGPSPAAEEMYTWLFDGIFENMQARIAAGRNVEVTQVRDWIRQGMYSAEKALAAGLIDAVETREDLTAFIKQQHGAAVKLDRRYGQKTAPEIDLSSPFGALQLWAQILNAGEPKRSTKDAIAIVHVDGAIMLGNEEASLLGLTEGSFSEPIRKALDSVADDPRVRAVVLRVNSPGGSATASEIILQAALRVKARKPLIVSMGDVAASGGYYVACQADRIFANESTITGSIGVLGGKLATGPMFRRVGVNFQPIQRGEKAGMLGSGGTFTDAERADLQAWMDEIYTVFKQHVVSGREGKLAKPIDDLAGGRVYTGKQALGIGLVDEIGSLDTAIRYAAQKANLTDYEIRVVPRPTNFLEQLLGDVSPNRKKDEPRLGLLPAFAPHLEGLDPFHMGMIREAVLQLELLRREQVLMALPVMRFKERLN